MEKITLCGANSYKQNYYLNEKFNELPEQVKKELQVMCVLFVEEVGGILTLEYDEDGELLFNVSVDDADYLYDEIECGIQMNRMQKANEELIRSLQDYYKILFLGKAPEEVLGAKPESEVNNDEGK